MNELIMRILKDFKVNGEIIPVNFLFYEGHDEPYITFFKLSEQGSYSGDDKLQGWVDYYDFDVYSKGNYESIIESLTQVLIENEFMLQPSKCSQDFYETDTGYYHRTLCFAIFKQKEV